MPNVEPHRLFATDIARLIESGGLTAEAVVASCLERITEREPVVRAWSYLAGDAALAEARAFDKAGQKALLGGVPFGLKDIFDAAGMPATYGSPIYTGWWPASDASAAALPKAAGGILLGKTVTTEFANRHPGPTSNPHDPAFTPGGSSSGSAAAVADFMVPLAIGTQTGGSVIRPAAYCGVVGFKPSFGLFPPAGMRINTENLDTVGIMARSVGDIALFRAAVMAIPYEPPAMPQTPPRLGLCRGPHWDDAKPEGRAVLEATVDRLAAAGARIVDTQFPPECAAADEIQQTLGGFEGLRNHMPELYRHEALLSAALRDEKIARGRKITLDQFRDACRAAEKARIAAREWASGFDAILTLPAPGQAPRTLASTGSAVFNAPWTQFAMPCMTLPAGHGPDGLPVGIQLVGRRHDDARLLETGLWVESRLGDDEMSGTERLTATEAAARLEAGALTAETLVRDCLDRAEARAAVKAWVWLDPEHGPGASARGRPRRPHRPAEGRAGRGQRRHRHLRHADPARLADLSGQPALCRRRLRGADPRGGRGHSRQDGDDRIRQSPPARDGASAQSRPHPWRFVERLGRRGRRFPGAGRLWHADRGLDDPPGRLLRRHRLQAELWRVQPGRHQDAVPQSRHARPDLSQPRRRCADAGGAAGAAPPSGRPAFGRAPHRVLPHAGVEPCGCRYPGAARADGLAARRGGRRGQGRNPDPG